jgi:DNA-binding transcriptional LysR family regulator
MNEPRIALEQWSALVAVVEAGGYAEAARRISRSQSTITYNIKRLENLLNVKAFIIKGRKASLTPLGEVLYRRGKALLNEASRLERAAADLARGWEPEIRVAVDLVFPTWLLLDSFAELAVERPQVRFDLIESVLSGTDEALTERRVDLGIGTRMPAGMLGDVLMQARFVCAAAPSHPLFAVPHELDLDDLRKHRHLVVRDSGVQRSRDGGWLNEDRWTVSNKATSIRAAVMGLGFAWYPEENIREELARGELKALPLREGRERFATVYLIFADHDAAGPGSRRLAEIIKARVAKSCRQRLQDGAIDHA